MAYMPQIPDDLYAFLASAFKYIFLVTIGFYISTGIDFATLFSKADQKTKAEGQPDPITPLNKDIGQIEPVKYRPFKYGPKYNVTMGLRKLDDLSHFIELDKEYLKYYNAKKDRLQSQGEGIMVNAKAEMAAKETLHVLINYLPKRYPKHFSSTNEWQITNHLTGDNIDINPKEISGRDALAISSLLVPDEFTILLPRSSIGTDKADAETYFLEAGAILLPGFWRLKDKMGKCIDEVHISGDVPQYEARLKASMNKFFTRLKSTDAPVLRHNYTIQTDTDLAWSWTLGNEESEPFDEKYGWFNVDKDSLAIDKLTFRSERQCLLRLHESNALLFVVRTYFVPVTQICDEPGVPARLLSAIKSWPEEDVAQYKGRDWFDSILIPYLERKSEEQKNMGIKVDTSNDSWPF